MPTRFLTTQPPPAPTSHTASTHHLPYPLVTPPTDPNPTFLATPSRSSPHPTTQHASSRADAVPPISDKPIRVAPARAYPCPTLQLLPPPNTDTSPRRPCRGAQLAHQRAYRPELVY